MFVPGKQEGPATGNSPGSRVRNVITLEIWERSDSGRPSAAEAAVVAWVFQFASSKNSPRIKRSQT